MKQSAPHAELPSLAEMVGSAPLVVCMGPGGVGKTTISAVLALRAAAARRRSLVLTIDPARRLADALNLPQLTNDPAEISSYRKMHPGGQLSALMLDAAATFDHLIAILVTDPERRKVLLANRFYQHMSRSLAGTLEYMAVDRLYSLDASNAYDTIVLDTPPTTNALDFLDAPGRIGDFFSKKVTRWLVPTRGKGWGARLFDRAGSRFMGLLSKVGGAEFMEETIGFFSAFGDLLGDFGHRGDRSAALLRDPQTVYVVVASPDPDRIAEAREIDRRLDEFGCRARAFVVNGVDSAFLPSSMEADRAIGRATQLLGGAAERDRVLSFITRLETMRRNKDAAAEIHADAVKELRGYAGDRPVFCAPRVPLGNSPRAALLAIYVGLFSEDVPAR